MLLFVIFFSGKLGVVSGAGEITQVKISQEEGTSYISTHPTYLAINCTFAGHW